MQDFRRPLVMALVGAAILAAIGCGFTLAIRHVTTSMGAIGSLVDVRAEMLSKGLQFGALGAFFGLLYAVTMKAPGPSPASGASSEAGLSKEKLDRLVQKQMRDAFGEAPPPSNPTAPPPTNVDR